MKKIYLTILVFFAISSSLFSQNIDADTKKLEKLADGYIKIDEWDNAIPSLEKILETKPTSPSANYKLGLCYYRSTNKSRCLKHFLLAKEANYNNKNLDFFLGRAKHFNHAFDEAVVYYQTYIKILESKPKKFTPTATKSQVEDLILNCQNGKGFVSDSVEIVIVNAGANINTRFADYAPIVSADETEMIFTSRRDNSTGGLLDIVDGKYFEDIYTSKYENGTWSPSKNLGETLNTSGHDAGVGLSPDGRKLFMYRSNDSRSQRGEILISDQKSGLWGTPVKMQGELFPRKSWESSLSVTSDENLIYFSSDRKGGFGGTDIYISKRQADGSWGLATNLGPTINTKYDEDAPIIHTDGKTLFFSSKGHSSIGGYDIFSSVKNEKDSSWSKPRNIGYPVNTADDDIFFNYTADGSKAYFSSYRADTYGEKDIYVLNRPSQSSSMIVLKGFITDAETQQPISAAITITDNTTGKVEKIINNNPNTGKYVVPISFGKDYNINVSSNRYVYYTENINIPTQADLFEYKKNMSLNKDKTPKDTLTDSSSLAVNKPVQLKKMKLGSKIILNNVFYETGSSELTDKSNIELKNLYYLLDNYKDIKIKIIGHTDDVGKAESNQILSESRAKSVVTYLTNKGIERSRLSSVGLGETLPIATNETKNGTEMNRRTEFEITEMEGISASKKAEVFVSMPYEVVFDVNKSEILPEANNNLIKLVRVLKSTPKIKIFLGSYLAKSESDLTLSTTRIAIIQKYLFSKGINLNRLNLIDNSIIEEINNAAIPRDNIETPLVKFYLSK